MPALFARPLGSRHQKGTTVKVAYLWQGDVVDLLGAQAAQVNDLGCVRHVDLNIRDFGGLVHQVWQGRQVDVQGVLGTQLQKTKTPKVHQSCQC